MKIHITPNDRGNPPGKLADAELHFSEGPLEGLKLIGFGIWEQRSTPSRRNVTFPARQYQINGERRSFALLRPIQDTSAQANIREMILQAYAEWEEQQLDNALRSIQQPAAEPEPAQLAQPTPELAPATEQITEQAQPATPQPVPFDF